MAKTPFDEHAARANEEGYHNHRVNTHSDLISEGIIRDVVARAPTLRADLDSGKVGFWVNRRNPWGRKRNTDFIVAEPDLRGKPRPELLVPLGLRGASAWGLNPDPENVRIIGEHKSVVTAHRNRSARHDDLDHLYKDANAHGKDVIVFATVMVGVAEWYLNVADGVKAFYDEWAHDASGKRQKVFRQDRFQQEFMPRVRAHDLTLMDDFIAAVSENSPRDVEATFELFRTLPRRPATERSRPGFDALLLVPIHYDNIHPARVERANRFGIDVDEAYDHFVGRVAADYEMLFGNMALARSLRRERVELDPSSRSTSSTSHATRDI